VRGISYKRLMQKPNMVISDTLTLGLGYYKIFIKL